MAANEWEIVETGAATGVITHGSLASAWPPPESRREQWSIGPAEVAELEAALPAALRARSASVAERLDTYTRWYVGYLRAPDKHPCVLAQFACVRPDDWRARVPQVDDGGDCYFTVVYDAKQNEIIRIVLNGEA